MKLHKSYTGWTLVVLFALLIYIIYVTYMCVGQLCGILTVYLTFPWYYIWWTSNYYYFFAAMLMDAAILYFIGVGIERLVKDKSK